MPDYGFRKITRNDEAMFKAWLTHAHIGGWWKDPDTEWALVVADIDDPAMDMRIVTIDGVPIGFIQDYNVHDWGMAHYADLPSDARAIDTFLGDPTYLGQGHGAGYVAARLAELSAVSTIAIDPNPANTRAISAYTVAGFRPHNSTVCDNGDPMQIMIFP